jgi:iron complex outermembrane receptor protein
MFHNVACFDANGKVWPSSRGQYECAASVNLHWHRTAIIEEKIMRRSIEQQNSQPRWQRQMLIIATTLLALMALPATSLAQSEAEDDEYGDNVLEEIIVTSARRREENVQDVPIAVSILSDEVLQDYNIMDLGDVSNIVPNSVISAGRATNSTIIAYIRGVGQNDPLWGFEPGVGVYMDDVFIARPQGALLDVYDVQSIEVLRGPQGTLYGKNTMSGAIKYNTRDIVGDPYARATVEAGNYSRIDLKAAGSAPINDNFYIGGSVAYLSRDGYGEVVVGEFPQLWNEIGEDVSDKDLLAGRVNAAILIGDNSRLKFAFDTVRDDSHARGSQRLNDAWGEPLDSRYDVRSDLPVNLEKVRMHGGSVTFDSDLNINWDMKLIGAYRKSDTDSWIDFETLNQPVFNVLGHYDDNQTSVEAQFNFHNDRWAAVMGAYYYDGDACGAFNVVLGLFGITSLTEGCVKTKSISIYGDATWAMTDNWNLSFGGRWNQDKKTASVFVGNYLGVLQGPETALDPDNIPPNLTLFRVDSDYTNDRKFNDFTPRVSIDYHFNENVMAYFSYTNGFKSGGFDMRGNQAAFPGTVDGYDSENVDNWEIGLKTTALDGDLIFNVTAFLANYTDVQITTQQFVDIGGIPTNATAVLNAGKQKNKGVEIETMWQANEHFRLTAMLGFLDADITEFLGSDPDNPGDIIDISDTADPLFSPDLTALLSAEFFWGMGSGEGYGRLSYAYTDDIKTMNLTPSVGDQDSYGLLDATIAYITQNGKWRFAVNGSNLTNKKYLQAGYDFGSAINYISQLGFYGAPRTWSVSATFTY